MINLEQMLAIAALPSQEARVWEAARAYIKNGLYVLPIRKNSKILPPKSTRINYGAASRKPSVIESWFHPTNGRFRGWNIAIACGREGGAFAVDVDIRRDAEGRETANGFKSLEKLEDVNSALKNIPVQKTPSGGAHYLFRWIPFALSSTDKIAKGIDTRGGTEDACKGHIVVFPSTVDDQMYQWVQGGHIIPPPDPVMERMGLPTHKGPVHYDIGPGRGNENVTAEDEEIKVDLEQIKKMIEHIDPNLLSYDEWLRIGQSIHSQHPTHDGLEVWDKWSQLGTRYRPGECNIRWNGFDESGSIRIGTLFFMAKSHGWSAQEEDVQPGHWNDLIEKMNSRHAMVIVGGKLRILREKTQYDPALGAYDLLNRNDFITYFANDTHAFINPATGKTVIRTSAEIWLASEQRRTYENGMGCFPNGAPPGYYNTWNGWSYEPEPDSSCDLWLNHVREVICRGNDEYYDWIMDWMADAVQNPDDPKGAALVLKGKEGTGKGTFAETFGLLFGNHYRHLIDDHHLTGNFNSHLQDAIVVYADEIIWGGYKKAAGKLKGIVTERYVMVERKGVDAVSMKNMVHLIIASNEDWVIPAGPQSRRWFVLDVSDKHIGNREYFKKIRSQMKNGGMGALLNTLLERDVVSDLRRAPETKELHQQRVLHQNNDASSPLHWWYDVLVAMDLGIPDEEAEFDKQPKWPLYVNRDLMYESYRSWCMKMSIKPEFKKQWGQVMNKLGLSVVRSRNDSERVYKFVLKPWPDCINIYEKATGIPIEIVDEEYSNETADS